MYRPRFATSKIGEIWVFSKWWMLLDAMRFFGGRGEAFILGGLTTPQVIGAYSVGADLSLRLTEDVVGPIGRALVPSYAKSLEKPVQLLRAFQLSFALLATFSLAAGVGLSLVAKDLVLVLLGSKWLSAVPFVQWLALHGAFWSMVQSMQPYFLITKRERLSALCHVAYVAVLIPIHCHCCTYGRCRNCSASSHYRNWAFPVRDVRSVDRAASFDLERIATSFMAPDRCHRRDGDLPLIYRCIGPANRHA